MKIDAVIHIGSTQFRLVIAEYGINRKYRVLDKSEKSVNLGKNVFTTGQISVNTMNESIEILKFFKEQLDGWKIPTKSVKVFATSALRESKNRDTFIDRVEIRTGFVINVIDGIEEIRLSYMAVQYALTGIQSKISRSNSIIIEVGGGSTEVILLRRGRIVTVHSLSIGAVKVEQQFLESEENTKNKLDSFILHNLNPLLERLDSDLNLNSIKNIIAIGNYAKQSIKNIETDNQKYLEIDCKEYNKNCETVSPLNIEGNGLNAALKILQLFIASCNSENLIIPQVSIDEGIFMEEKGLTDDSIHEKYAKQVIASAETLGKKYNYDINHAKHVTKLSLELFDNLQDEHSLSKHHRMLLEVSAILHDVGSFIKTSGHHKHGMYIVQNSEIFGLSETELKIVSNLVRYHRKGTPQKSHSSYISLSRENRILILKLASILRIADALDRGHIQRIESLKIEKSSNKITILAEYTGDISVERFSLASKSAMFQEVYGFKVEIR